MSTSKPLFAGVEHGGTKCICLMASAPDDVRAQSRQLLHTIDLATAPRRIIVSGGVAQARPELRERVRRLLLYCLNGYLALEAGTGPIEENVVSAGLQRTAAHSGFKSASGPKSAA